MKIFGWKSTGRSFARPAQSRAAPRVALARTYGTYSLGEWPRNYEQQVREGYLHNAIAQRAVRLVAEGVAAAPLTASDPAALALVKATSGGQALIETVAVHLLLHGNAYVELLTGGRWTRRWCALRTLRAAARPRFGRGRCARLAGGVCLQGW